MKAITLVIPFIGVGGAEKRLAGIWLELSRRGLPMRMILPAKTFKQLLHHPDLADLVKFRRQITIFFPLGASFLGRVRGLLPVLRRQARGGIFHYPLAFPPLLHRLRGDRVILSWVATALPELKATKSAFANWLVTRCSISAADRVDVLNPEVAKVLKRNRDLAEKLSITAGGTFVDFSIFKPSPAKRDEVVFLGTMLRAKGVLDFLEAIPVIHDRLCKQGRHVRFHLIGKEGDASDAIRRALVTPAFAGIDIQIGETSDPASLLSAAKVFVSLQKVSNYPSRALAEVMASGCVPIISDVGESRLMADNGSAVFLHSGYEPRELSDAIVDVLSLDAEAFNARSAAARAAAKERFSMFLQADYFEQLYRSTAAF